MVVGINEGASYIASYVAKYSYIYKLTLASLNEKAMILKHKLKLKC